MILWNDLILKTLVKLRKGDVMWKWVSLGLLAVNIVFFLLFLWFDDIPRATMHLLLAYMLREDG